MPTSAKCIGKVDLSYLFNDGFPSKWGLTSEQVALLTASIEIKIAHFSTLPRTKENIRALRLRLESLLEIFNARVSVDTDGTLDGLAAYVLLDKDQG